MADETRSDAQLTNDIATKSVDLYPNGKVAEEVRTGSVISGYTVITKSMIGSGT